VILPSPDASSADQALDLVRRAVVRRQLPIEAYRAVDTPPSKSSIALVVDPGEALGLLAVLRGDVAAMAGGLAQEWDLEDPADAIKRALEIAYREATAPGPSSSLPNSSNLPCTFKLSQAHIKVLEQVFSSGPSTMSDLVTSTSLCKTTVQSALRNLYERKALLVRKAPSSASQAHFYKYSLSSRGFRLYQVLMDSSQSPK